jgi:oligopeptide/dipeptide ABC transporter ATP-binding protein
MAGNDEILIDVKGLTKIYTLKRNIFSRSAEFVTAVYDANFGIKTGEVFGLVGESGSGKTTCGRILSRLEEPTGGQIRIDGVDISHLKGKDLQGFRKRVQMIFQDPYESINPRMTVYDTVVEPLEVQGIGDYEEREYRVWKALKTVELYPPRDYLFRFPHELSGGQRQRVAIARALVVEPDFVIADEPVSMLDASIRAGILNLLLDLRNQFGLTYLFITHDVAIARYMCDRMAVVFRGKLVEMGKTERLIAQPHHPYTRALLSAVPIPDPRAKRDRFRFEEQEVPDHAFDQVCIFLPRCAASGKICRRESPEMVEVAEDHYAACHLSTDM